MKKKRHPLRKLLIVLTLLAAYACAIILPYARQPAVTADTAGQFSSASAPWMTFI